VWEKRPETETFREQKKKIYGEMVKYGPPRSKSTSGTISCEGEKKKKERKKKKTPNLATSLFLPPTAVSLYHHSLQRQSY
jgi:hypothetical protein